MNANNSSIVTNMRDHPASQRRKVTLYTIRTHEAGANVVTVEQLTSAELQRRKEFNRRDFEDRWRRWKTP